MTPERRLQIALIVEEWRLLQFGSERYMGELKAVGQDMGIPDAEMMEFCMQVLADRIQKVQAKKQGSS